MRKSGENEQIFAKFYEISLRFEISKTFAKTETGENLVNFRKIFCKNENLRFSRKISPK
jgi:hypothetical protein